MSNASVEPASAAASVAAPVRAAGKSKRTIAAAAREAGVGIETIRYYERRGLIQQPKASGGYRHYSDHLLRQIRFIRTAQRLGFTLRQIQELLALAERPDLTCGQVCSATEAKLAEVRERLRSLEALERELEAMLCNKDCPDPARDCKLLEALEV